MEEGGVRKLESDIRGRKSMTALSWQVEGAPRPLRFHPGGSFNKHCRTLSNDANRQETKE